MKYVDGFVIPVPRKNMARYRRMAQRASKIFREHGALEVWETVGDDLQPKMAVPFSRRLRLKRGETVVFSWIVFKSRASRDRANARIAKDPRLADMMDPKDAPFDMKRMVYGGFKVMVEA